MDDKREMLRHCVATLAYRAAKVFRDAPDDVSSFRIGSTSRTPAEIAAHLVDLLTWATSLATGNESWPNTPAMPLKEAESQFFSSLAKFDALLSSDAELACSPERLFQGPIADALTHVGQIAMIRRCAEAPVRGENYFVAEIVVGHSILEQAPPRKEFD